MGSETSAATALTQCLVIDHDIGGSGDWAVDVPATLAALAAAGWSLAARGEADALREALGKAERVLRSARSMACGRVGREHHLRHLIDSYFARAALGPSEAPTEGQDDGPS